MHNLPMTEKGYLKPWFVKADDFRVVDNDKARLAIDKKNCWICGNPFKDSRYALVGSPLSAVTRIFREPPCHQDCAEYAMKVCPFILYSDAKRRDVGLPKELSDEELNKGLRVKHDPSNPGEYYLVVVDNFHFNSKDMTLHYANENILEIQYWKNGSTQSNIPNPILEYEHLPDEVRLQIDRKTFYEHYTTRISSNKPANWIELSYEKLQEYLWLEDVDYDFASRQKTVPITANEIIHAVHHLPTGFTKQGGVYTLVAILDLNMGHSARSRKQKDLLHDYTPDFILTYPFRLKIENEKAEVVLDINSNRVTSTADESAIDQPLEKHTFFLENRDLNPKLIPIIEHLKENFRNARSTASLVESLDHLNLIRPWNIQLQSRSASEPVKVDGFYCIDESKLDQLSGKQLEKLRDSGALAVVYCQLLSMAHIRNF